MGESSPANESSIRHLQARQTTMSKSRPSDHARIPQSEGVLVSGSGYSCTIAAVTLYMGSATSKTMAKGHTRLPKILQEPLDLPGG